MTERPKKCLNESDQLLLYTECGLLTGDMSSLG